MPSSKNMRIRMNKSECYFEERALFFIGDEQKTLRAGDLYRIPGHVKHRVVALAEPVRAIDIFYPVREDYR